MGTPADPPVASVLTPGADRFKVLALLKKSRFQTVTLVTDLAARQDKVARLLAQPPGATEIALLEGISREESILRKLSHPNLPAFDKVVEGLGGTWLLFQYEPGADLSQYIRIESRVPTDWIVWWLYQLLQVLNVLHTFSPRMVVGYIEPSDLVVRDHRLFLVDLGLFEDIFPHVTTLSRHSFVNFIAPERRTSMQVSPSTDLFSAGAIAFWLSTGRAPVATGPDSAARMRQALAKYRTDLKPPVADLIAALLEHQPDRRPASAAAALERLSPRVTDMTGQMPPIALENTDHKVAAEVTRSIQNPPQPLYEENEAAEAPAAAARPSAPVGRPLWMKVSIGLGVLSVVILAAAPRAPQEDSGGPGQRGSTPAETTHVAEEGDLAGNVSRLARVGGSAVVEGDKEVVLARHKSVVLLSPGSRIAQLSPLDSDGPQFTFTLEHGEVRARTGANDTVEVRLPGGQSITLQGNCEAVVHEEGESASVTCHVGAVFLESASTRLIIPAGKTHAL